MKSLIRLVFLFLYIATSATAEERHLRNVRQLTFGGENAEAYFSPDGKRLIFQSTRDKDRCDQIYTIKTDGSDLRKISSGGRTTCGYFLPDDSRVIYSSTHQASTDCPGEPDFSRGYVWPVYGEYEIYSAKQDGSDPRNISNSAGYDAEATVSPDGKWVLFTSDRDGDLELYRMTPDGKNVQRLTSTPGYDGGAFFSPDSRQIVFRAHHIEDVKELDEFRSLLKEHLVRPSHLELFIMDADGKNLRQITRNGAANFCPYFSPDGKRIIFASNVNDPAGRNFDLYMIGTDGTHLEQITNDPTFDGFPMFSPDGKKLVFASNRNAKVQGETNIFLADWVESESVSKDTGRDARSTNDIPRIQADVKYLSSDELKGRLTGTPEAKKAAEYVADQFQRAGLQKHPKLSSYFQEFEFTSGVRLGAVNTFKSKAGDQAKEFKTGVDFIPAGFSGNAALENLPLAFAGFGISAGELSHDDYKNLEAKGKGAIVFRYGPEGNDPKSKYALYYSLRYKAMVARDHGASALLVIINSKEKIPTLRTDRGAGPSGLPILYITESMAKTLFDQARQKFPDRNNFHDVIPSELKGVSVNLKTDLLHERSTSANVVGWLPAQDASETVIIGAHYDHLGTGIEGSLASKTGDIHNGADDNASGVSSVLETARHIAARAKNAKRNVLFIAFSGEELGLLGSQHFIKNPILNVSDVIAMLNMDMIGRLRDKLVIGGAGTAKEWKDVLTQLKPAKLDLTLQDDGYGPSDHSSFYGAQIPVLFFFTGSHSDYHRPEDDADKINYNGLSLITGFVEDITERLITTDMNLHFTKAKASPEQGAVRGFRVSLGTIPDYSAEVKGVRLTGVREGSPAEKAGLKAGDVIVQLKGKAIENIYDYTFVLQDAAPGETAVIVVERDGEKLERQITFEGREQKKDQ